MVRNFFLDSGARTTVGTVLAPTSKAPGNSVEYTAIAAPDVVPGFRVHLADLLD